MKKIVTHLAGVFLDSPDWHIPKSLQQNFSDQVDHWYAKIPIPIRFVYDTDQGQPFDSNRDMARHCEKRGELLMLSQLSKMVGRDLYQRHRAVHDWFGHVATGDEFGAEAECYSFMRHVPMFTREVLPIVFSDVVLLNCYADTFPDGSGPVDYEKWVYDLDAMDWLIKKMQKRM